MCLLLMVPGRVAVVVGGLLRWCVTGASSLSQEGVGALAASPQIHKGGTLEETLVVFCSQETLVAGIGVVAMVLVGHQAWQAKMTLVSAPYLVRRAMLCEMGAMGLAVRQMAPLPHMKTLSLVARAFALAVRLV